MKTLKEIQAIVPTELQTSGAWCLWKLERKGGRQSKVPFQPQGAHASSTNPDTWNSLETCYRALQGGNYDGIGLILSPAVNLTFIDLDACLVDGEPNEFAQSVLERLPDTYTEISQSGRGLHLFVHGSIPHAVKKPEIEMYHAGRYCACTFHSYNGSTVIRSGGQELQDLYKQYAPKAKKKKRRAPAPLLFDDETTLKRALKSDSFADLYHGNWRGKYDSQSSADYALLCRLAFWTNRNPGQMERLFSSSGLVREKWTAREDYRRRSIERACADCEQTFSEWTWEKAMNSLGGGTIHYD